MAGFDYFRGGFCKKYTFLFPQINSAQMEQSKRDKETLQKSIDVNKALLVEKVSLNFDLSIIRSFSVKLREGKLCLNSVR